MQGGHQAVSALGVNQTVGLSRCCNALLIDGAWSAIGSSNLDWRSTVWNNEIDAIILGSGFGAQMETVFQADAASRTIDLTAWRRHGLGERVRELRAKLVERLL